MANQTFIPTDYDELLNHYKGLKKELNELKQNCYETSRQLKVNDALLIEYQSDIELLQSREKSQNEKFEVKVAGLEDSIANLRSSHLENITYLETQLEKKEKENEDLKSELEILTRKNSVEATVDGSANLNEIITLTNDNELLQEKVQETQDAFEYLQSEHRKLEETLEEYKEELTQVKENLKIKREELMEYATLTDKLNDELFCANRKLEHYKHKPLEAESKGNSLFAEVDDRRVHLQETINQMKTNYIRLRQEHGQHIKLISQLRKENAELRESWKKDLEETQEDKYWVNDNLKRRVEVLEELLENQKKQLQEQPMTAGRDVPDILKFYQERIDEKTKEIEEWKKKYSDTSLSKSIMSMNLAQANKKVRLLRIELQQLAEIRKTESENEIEKNVILCHKCQISKSRPLEDEKNRKESAKIDRIPIKSCLKPTSPVLEADLTLIFSNTEDTKKEGAYNIFSNDLSSCTVTQRKKVPQFDTITAKDDTKANNKTSISPGTMVDSILFEDKENVDLCNDRTVKEKGVTFSENTVDPVGNAARRRGARIFVVKKKSQESSISS